MHDIDDVLTSNCVVSLTESPDDIACKRGERLTVEIVHQAKPLMVRHGTCDGKTLRIAD